MAPVPENQASPEADATPAASPERPALAEAAHTDDTLILLAARGMLLFPRVVLPIVV